MWWVDVILSVVLPVCSGLGGVFLGSWYIRRELRHTQFDLAVLEERLLKEIKRRAAEARWPKDEETPPDVTAAIAAVRQLALGEEDPQGWVKGKEGGVDRGPR